MSPTLILRTKGEKVVARLDVPDELPAPELLAYAEYDPSEKDLPVWASLALLLEAKRGPAGRTFLRLGRVPAGTMRGRKGDYWLYIERGST